MIRGNTTRESAMMIGNTTREGAIMIGNTKRGSAIMIGNIMEEKITIKESIKIENAERRSAMKERAVKKGALNKCKFTYLFSSFFLID